MLKCVSICIFIFGFIAKTGENHVRRAQKSFVNLSRSENPAFACGWFDSVGVWLQIDKMRVEFMTERAEEKSTVPPWSETGAWL